MHNGMIITGAIGWQGRESATGLGIVGHLYVFLGLLGGKFGHQVNSPP
jgi:hypothetical protein